ncbi:AfsR/SARP family transcriptional regulator [Micromonospora haikouensis]|uniref:AfsR/SARP family transcriptional regulator n=1 Tax=Micromonospora haikouensis TaxID=686309 RepID=UPI003D8B2C58
MLGSLVVTTAGGAQALGGPAPRLLIQRLIVANGRMVTIGELVEDVWPDDPPESAVATIQTYVSRLRKVFEPGNSSRASWQILVRQGPGYALRLPAGAVDADRFVTLAREGADHLAAGAAGTALAALDQALALWRGPAYADCAEQPFARPEAHRLDELRVTATENRLAALLDLGDHQSAAALEAYTEAYPLRERGWELLALARYRQGRQGDALGALRSARRHITEGLGLDLGAGLLAVQSAILAQDPALAAPPRQAVTVSPPDPSPPPPAGHAGSNSNGLPVRLSSFVGRDDELRTVSGLLDQHRLVTLTGAGGMGKTRLALEVARLRTDEDGPWLVELAGLHDRTLVAGTVAKVVGVAASSTAALATVLRDRHALLVLDNCEHLVDEVAPFVEHLLGAAPGLRVLATSRETLGAEAEYPYEVPPLSAGADGTAVRLFLDRAATAAADWAPADADRAVLADICAGLDGMPLAIELAAAQCNTLSIGQITELITDRFTLLRRGRRANSRHATMLAAVEWSYDLLTPDEQEVFQALAVFEGGFVLDAARLVCGRDDVLVPLSSLVAKSLVTVVGGDPRRYRMLETLRQFALLRTEPARHGEFVRRHVAWVSSLADLTDAGLLATDLTIRLNEESANVRAALERAGDPATVLRIAAGFYWFWYREGLSAEGLRYLEPAVAYWDSDERVPAPDPDTLARAWLGVALLYYLSGALDRIGAALGRALAYAGRGTDQATEAQVLATVSYFETGAGQVAAAREHAEHALRVARTLGRVYTEAEALMVLGEVERQAGRLDASADRLRQSTALARRCGYSWVAASAQWIHAKVELARPDLAEAQRLTAATIEETDATSDTTSWLVGIATLSHIRHRLGHLAQAAELVGIVDWHGSRTGYSPYDMDPELAGYVQLLRAELPADDYAEAAHRGRGRSRPDVMAYIRRVVADDDAPDGA